MDTWKALFVTFLLVLGSVCGQFVKEGTCPTASEDESNGTTTAPCQMECQIDEDCSGDRKCCAIGCSKLCVFPVGAPPVTRTLPFTTRSTTTWGPFNGPAPRVALIVQPRPDVSINTTVTLTCKINADETVSGFAFLKDGEVVQRRGGKSGQKYIFVASANTKGKYQCQGNSDISRETGVSEVIEITVNETNGFLPTPVGVSGPTTNTTSTSYTTSTPTTLPDNGDVCSQRPDGGFRCKSRELKWYFNFVTGTCQRFVYSGCNGNDNRFDSLQDCESRCKNNHPTCAPYQEWLQCGRCEQTCETKDNPVLCRLQCTPGCYCKEGYVLQGSTCIPADECPSNTSVAVPPCDTNEARLDCAQVCTCDEIRKGAECPITCVSMEPGTPFPCMCKPGFVRNATRKCVPNSECIAHLTGDPAFNESASSPTSCPANMERNFCQDSCSCLQLNETGQCSHLCLDAAPGTPPPCLCKAGFFLDSDTNKCRAHTECGSCPTNMERSFCQDSCSCLQFNETGQCSHLCLTVAPGTPPPCSCKAGFFLDSDTNKCRAHNECSRSSITSQSRCGPNEHFEPCGGCDQSCRNRGQALICPAVCKIDGGCACNTGYYRNSNQTCVTEDQCLRDQTLQSCPANEELQNCGTACELTCETVGAPTLCTFQCVSGCFCKPGFIRQWKGGPCIVSSQCNANNNASISTNSSSKSICEGANEIWQQCPACTATCSVDHPICTPGRCPPEGVCVCRDGFVRTDDGTRCIVKSQCPGVRQSQACNSTQEEYLECGTACPLTCNDITKQRVICTTQCVAGCFCKPGLVRNANKECVLPDQCIIASNANETETKCLKANERFDPCGGCDSRCDSLDQPRICPASCRLSGGCVCQTGYYRNALDECVSRDQCTVANNATQCPTNEVASTCGSACPPTCATRNQGSIICTSQCVQGCFCRQGFVRRFANAECVPESACDLGNVTQPITSDHSGRCNLPFDVGPCDAAIPSFYYDGATRSCKIFTYGGCSGNDNRFQTFDDCMNTCFALKSDGRCPGIDGSRPVNCLADPCHIVQCPAYPNARCIQDYCGGCKARFFSPARGQELSPELCQGTITDPAVPLTSGRCIAVRCEYCTVCQEENGGVKCVPSPEPQCRSTTLPSTGSLTTVTLPLNQIQNPCIPNPCKPCQTCTVERPRLCLRESCEQARCTDTVPGCDLTLVPTCATLRCPQNSTCLDDRLNGASCVSGSPSSNGSVVTPFGGCATARCGDGQQCIEDQLGRPQCQSATSISIQCTPTACASCELCIPEPKFCKTIPCPQYRCERTAACGVDSTSPCAGNPCGLCQRCLPEPKQCFTTPCDQFRCEDLPSCPQSGGISLTREKAGACPDGTTSGIVCNSLCSIDSDCPGVQKCCLGGCPNSGTAKSCQDPVRNFTSLAVVSSQTVIRQNN